MSHPGRPGVQVVYHQLIRIVRQPAIAAAQHTPPHGLHSEYKPPHIHLFAATLDAHETIPAAMWRVGDVQARNPKPGYALREQHFYFPSTCFKSTCTADATHPKFGSNSRCIYMVQKVHIQIQR